MKSLYTCPNSTFLRIQPLEEQLFVAVPQNDCRIPYPENTLDNISVYN